MADPSHCKRTSAISLILELVLISPYRSPPVNTLPSPSVAANNDLEKPEIFSEPTLTDILEKTGMQYFKTLYIAKVGCRHFTPREGVLTL